MKHWAEQYIGKPWAPGAFGPNAFDCWGLVWTVAFEHFGFELPKYQGSELLTLPERASKIKEEVGNFIPSVRPGNGFLVGLGGKEITHVGIFLTEDTGRVLHCRQESGVTFDRLSTLRMIGMSRIEFYKFNG